MPFLYQDVGKLNGQAAENSQNQWRSRCTGRGEEWPLRLLTGKFLLMYREKRGKKNIENVAERKENNVKRKGGKLEEKLKMEGGKVKKNR